MNISLNMKQAVEASGLTRSHIYEALKRGDLRARKAGRRTILIASELEDYIRSLPTAA